MKIAGTGGSHRDGTRPYPHFFLLQHTVCSWGYHMAAFFGENMRLALRGHRYDVQALPCTSRRLWPPQKR